MYMSNMPELDQPLVKQIAPLKKIEALKQQTLNMVKDNTRYKEIVEKNDQKYHKINAGINEMKKQKVQATYDKVELLRDLATYEINFSNKMGSKSRLNTIIDSVG